VASKKKYKISKSGKQQTRAAETVKPEQKKRVIIKPVIPGRWQINALIFLLLVIASVLFYSGDLHLGFFEIDDPQYVVNNPWIKNMSRGNLNFILSSPYFANYSPLHLFSYMLDYTIAGPNAYAFHLSSNIWAGVVAGFVFLVALALTTNRIVAVAAAALFIVHPAHVEAVAWISSRKDLVAAAFVLPSLLAYLRYRRGGDKKWLWYILSLALFLVALSGKLSVATFPAVFLAIDFFMEKRPLARSIADKIPFIIVAAIIASVVASAQPQMGNRPDAFVLLQAAAQNLWLLSGFGVYVLYRIAPESGGVALQLAGIVLLLLIFIAPLLLRRRLPLVAVLIYWMLFAFIPSQILSFTHPVTDRYLFFPSVAIVILIAWGLITVAKRFGRKMIVVSVSLMVIFTILWSIASTKYLNEWKDPRSVWNAAEKKSADPVVTQNLGSYFVGRARSIGDSSSGNLLSKEEEKRLASVVWSNDQRLSKLFSELSEGKRGGPMEKEFRNQVFSLAWDALEKSLHSKGNRVMPGLFYNRGLILLERGDLKGGRKEFLAGVEEASKESFAEVRNQVTVYCYTDLGIIEMKLPDYREALKWFRMAEKLQNLAGANWVPTLSTTCKQLENAIASQSAH
jgi:hypothetical protein